MNSISVKVYEHIGHGLYTLFGDSLMSTAHLNNNIGDLLGDMDLKLRELRFLNLFPEVIWRLKPQVRQIILCFYATSCGESQPGMQAVMYRTTSSVSELSFSFSIKGEDKGKVSFIIHDGDWKVQIVNPLGISSTIVEVKESNIAVNGGDAPISRYSKAEDEVAQSSEPLTVKEQESNVEVLTEEEARALLK